jgi:hypothetical protein
VRHIGRGLALPDWVSLLNLVGMILLVLMWVRVPVLVVVMFGNVLVSHDDYSFNARRSP